MTDETRQFIPLPQAKFVEAYLDETSSTFLNPILAAKENNLTTSDAIALISRKNQWFKELAEEHPMLKQAEENLSTFLSISPFDEDHADRVLKASMFIAERLGKHRYSTRSEISGPDGKPLIPKEEVEIRLLNLKTKQIE